MFEISLDFETFSEEDLSNGAWKYSEHPSTEILLASYFIHHENKMYTYRYDNDDLTPFDSLISILQGSEPYIVRAWNANFERAIYENVAVGKLGLPPIKPEAWVDDMVLAAYYAYPMGLEACGEVLGLSDTYLKDKKNAQLTKKFCVPHAVTKTNTRTRIHAWDAPEDFENFIAYNKQDVVAEMATVAALPCRNLPEHEQVAWLVDSEINRRGVLIDKKMALGATSILERYSTEKLTRLAKITDGAVTAASQVARIGDFIQALGCDSDSLNKTAIAKLLQDKELHPVAREVLETRQELAKPSTTKYVTMCESASEDGRVKSTFQFLGASRTGRFAGRKLQLHNVPRGEELPEDLIQSVRIADYDAVKAYAASKSTNVFHLLSSGIRQAVIAPEGQTLGIVDYSSIENRIAAWYSGDKDALNAFEAGRDQYKDMASSIFKVEYSEVTKEQRTFSKPVVLARMYGIGVDKLIAYAAGLGITLTPKEAASHLATYDARYPLMSKIRRAIGNAAKDAIRTPGKSFRVGNAGYGSVAVKLAKGNLYCKLPSGRTLCYSKAYLTRVERLKNVVTGEVKIRALTVGEIPRAIEGWESFVFDQINFFGVHPTTKKWSLLSTYDSKLFENICQATSRDILMNALVNLHQKGYKTVFHLHDEIGCELQKTQSLSDMKTIMCSKAPWFETLPIECEGITSQRFRKS